MRPFELESTAVTFSAAAVIVLLGALSWRDGELLAARGEPEAQLGRGTGLRRWGNLAWALAIALALAVELWELFHLPRSSYPTLSSLANEVIGPGHRVGRALAFVCWALGGLVLASRPRSRA